ncbi:MAG: hypothetical protein ACRDD2_04805 [Sarcina sp.]
MGEKLSRYLETYKRMYFKGQIGNEKSNLILERKRINLNLNEEEARANTEELLNKFNELIDFIKNILEVSDFQLGDQLETEDREEIVEYWRDLELSDEDGEKILNITIETIDENNQYSNKGNFDGQATRYNNFNTDKSENYYEGNIIVEEVQDLNEDYSKGIEPDFVKEESAFTFDANHRDTGVIIINKKEKTLLEEYKEIIEKNKDNRVVTMQVRLLNLVISYGLGFENELFLINNRKEVTATNMVSMFKATYFEFLNDLMVSLKESNLIDLDNIPEYTLEEFFNYDVILKYAEKIDILNKAIDDGEDETTFAWLARSTMQFESRKILSKLTVPVVDYIVKIIRNCKGKRAVSNEKEFKAFKVIDDILIMMIANLTNRALYNVNELISQNLYDSTLDLLQIIESKQKGLVHLEEIKKLEGQIDSKKGVFLLISALKEYPYLESAHLEAINILSNNDLAIRKRLLELAYKIIEPSGESCNEINNELIEMGNKIYTESLDNLSDKELEFDEIRAFCEELQSKFNITDANTIVQIELNNFGKVISVVNYKQVNEDLRVKLYRKDMAELKKSNPSDYERTNRIAYLREHYNIQDQKLIIDTELSNFSTIISEDVDFSLVEYEIRRELYENKLNELQYEYDQERLEMLIIEAKVNYKIKLTEARDMELMKFGRWFGELDLSDKLEEDIYKYIRSLSQNILMQPINEDKKSELLAQLKEKSGFSTHEFYAIQNKIGNGDIALNDEDTIELEFVEKALEVFNKYPNMILESKLRSFKEADFHCGVFIRNFENTRKELRDKELFTLRKENNKDGFLITSKAIYHSSWNKAILYKDIKKIIWKEKSEVKGTQRFFRPYLFIGTGANQYIFEFIGFRQIDIFRNFLMDLINCYKMLTGEERCKYEECSVTSNSLSIEDMLDGNKYFAKYKGDIESTDDIINYVIKEADYNMRRHLRFQQPKARLDGKIKNAINSYASIKNDEVPVLCFDSTIFKSGKEGFLVTSKAVYCKNKFGTPWSVDHKNMKFIKLQDENIIFNDRQTTMVTVEEGCRNNIRDLIEFLSFLFKNIENK